MKLAQEINFDLQNTTEGIISFLSGIQWIDDIFDFISTFYADTFAKYISDKKTISNLEQILNQVADKFMLLAPFIEYQNRILSFTNKIYVISTNTSTDDITIRLYRIIPERKEELLFLLKTYAKDLGITSSDVLETFI